VYAGQEPMAGWPSYLIHACYFVCKEHILGVSPQRGSGAALSAAIFARGRQKDFRCNRSRMYYQPMKAKLETEDKPA